MDTSKSSSILRLYELWRDYWFIEQSLFNLWRKQGSIPSEMVFGFPNVFEFPKYLLGLSKPKNQWGRFEYFIGVPYNNGYGSIVTSKPGWHILALNVPDFLRIWSGLSRRVFSLKPETQLALSATRLNEISFADYRLPFPAFLLELPMPIRTNIGGFEQTVTCVAVWSWDRDTTRGLTFLEKSVGRIGIMLIGEQPHPALSREDRSEVQQQLRTLNLNGAEARLTDLQAICAPKLAQFYFDLNDPVKSIEEISAKTFGDASEAVAQIARIVFGFPLFCTSAENTQVMSRTVLEGDTARVTVPDKAAVLNEAYVFEIASSFELSAGQREALVALLGQDESKRKSFEMRWHLRMGHFRRPPGQGKLSDAPKSVWVRPTIVRKDRAPDEDALPGASERIL